MQVPGINSFTYSPEVAAAQQKDLTLRLSALNTKIDYIVNKVEINGMPILKYILGLSTNKDVLERLGKALLRVAPYVDEYSELEFRKKVVDMAIENTGLAASLMGDLSGEIETITSELTQQGESS